MNTRHMLFAFIFIIMPSHALFAQQSKEAKSVCTWSQACPPGKQLRIEALLYGKQIFRKDVNICLIDRSKIPVEKFSALKFSFEDPGAVFDEERPKAGPEKLEGNISEAGMEADGLILGVSIVRGNAIL